MKKVLFVIVLFYSVTTVVSCNNERKKKVTEYRINDQSESEKKEDKENEDGAYESLMMEYEMTRDPKLGYVPRNRLVRAYDDLLNERKSGRVARISALNWVERGPFTDVVGATNGNTRGPGNNAVTAGRIRAIHVDLTDATRKTVWVGSVSGGLWKTNNITASPANWILVNDFLGNLAVASICQDPTNPQIMYFATGERNGNIDAVRGGGIWKSTNNGVSWSLLPSTTSFWNASKIVCDAAGNVYIGTAGNGQGLQRSTDGGTTWTNITPATTGNGNRITDLRISSTGRMHVTMGAGGSTVSQSGYFYVDNPVTATSASWQSPITPFLNYQYNCELAVAGNTLYVLPSDANDRTPQIYKSTDGGVNWAPTTTSPPSGPSDSQSSPSINIGQGWYDLAIGVDPANPNIVIAGGLNFFKSDDGGTSWTQITRWVGTALNYVHADHHSVVWNGTQVMVATDGGIFLSSDNGNSYEDRNIGLRIKQFYSCAIHPTTTNYFLGGTQDNGTHQLTAAGLGASTEVLGGDGGFTHIDENEPQYQFGSTTRSQYRRSVNGGASWSSVNFSNSIGLFINPTDYDDMNNRMYTSGSAGTYVRWDNPQTGSTFSIVSISGVTTNSVTSLKVSPYTNNRVFFGSASGRVVKADNAHVAFPDVTNITGSNMPTTTISSINVGTNDNNLIATFSNYGVQHVFVTTVGGGASGWTNITGNLPDIPVRWGMFYPEDNDKAIIATDMGIYETDDINGSSTVWVQNITFPIVRTNMLQYRQRDGTILAATHGRGLWTSSFPSSVPYIRFAGSYVYTSLSEGTTATGEICRNYRDITIPMRIDAAPAGNAVVTLNIQGGGTATQGVDYDFTTNGNFGSPSNTLAFNNGSTTDQNITVRIYNDAEVETAESFTLNYTVSGVTNALAAPSSQSFTVTLTDDDIAPTPPVYNGNFSIGQNETTLSNNSPFRTDRSRFRVQYLFTAAELGSAGMIADGYIRSMTMNVITKNSTQPFTGFTISMGNTTATSLNTGFNGAGLTQVYSANYSTVAGVNLFTFTTPFYWDGVSNLLVNICYDKSTTESSADLVEATSAPFGSSNPSIRASTWSDAVSSSGCSLNAAFIDYNRINTTFNAVSGNSIASTVGTNRSEYVGGTGLYSFYNGFDIIGRIGTPSRNFGCVNTSIAEAGNSWQTFFAGSRSQKIVFVDFVGTPQNSSYTVGVYFTAAELGGKDPNQVRLAGTTAGTIAGANSGNSNVYTTTVIGFGTGYLFTANVFGPGLYFLAEAAVTPIRDPSRQADFVKLLQNPVSSVIPINISNQSRQQIAVTLFTSNGQLLQRWNLGRTDGNSQLPINEKSIPDGVYILRIDAGNKTQSFKLVKQ
ncbi:T9SS type A sorting domain-containing protein [Lacibacter sp.]|uniref:T9SS type A sorting domain-containing protein n=1 Tax=Lacibacter sp. TaxID=1915409 RepID=UPI002B4B7F8D|nr:T9SS type A sorting domain-containing protein [Lacibacter sp.]HLP35417.1 T9SS type A sorting domain-containing protein [Lacibacter sp.]